ncbi:MAG: hypothetical protein HOP18_19320, partial [Deltaproteobacteria bacterium]|nr:hypothetical protein [Deltaproteobacteria bacterium]
MADFLSFRWHLRQKREAAPHEEFQPLSSAPRQRGRLRFLILPALLYSLPIAGSSPVLAQSPPVNLSEIIVKRLEIRRPPEPELTPIAPEPSADPNGSSAVDAANTEEASGAPTSPSQPSAAEQMPQPAAPDPT